MRPTQVHTLPLSPCPPPCAPQSTEPSSLPPDNTCYEGYSSYDIADLIKLYFRQLPEPLLTSKLSEILITIYESKAHLLRVTQIEIRLVINFIVFVTIRTAQNKLSCTPALCGYVAPSSNTKYGYDTLVTTGIAGVILEVAWFLVGC